MPEVKNLCSIHIDTLFSVLASLNGKSLSAIARETGLMGNTVMYTVNTLEKNNMVQTRKNGRVRMCYLTEKGKVFLSHLQQIKSPE